MECCRDSFIWLSLLTCLLGSAGGSVTAQESGLQRWTSTRLPLDQLPTAIRERVCEAVDHPTLYAQGPTETFPCDPTVYHWFLDHPDRAAAAWRRLGAKVVDINDRGNGRFGWVDGAGSDVHWDTIYRDDHMRIWHAQGEVKPGPLVAAVPFHAVLVLRYTTGQDDRGGTIVRHQADLALHTDSRSALVIAKLIGAAAPRLAEQYVGQLEMFFSALPWYIEKHPERAQELLSAEPGPASENPPPPRKRPGLFRSRSGS